MKMLPPRPLMAGRDGRWNYTLRQAAVGAWADGVRFPATQSPPGTQAGRNALAARSLHSTRGEALTDGRDGCRGAAYRGIWRGGLLEWARGGPATVKHQDPQDGHSEQRGMGDDGREWILTRSQDGLMLADRAGRCYCCWWWVVMLWSEQFWCGWGGGEEKSAGVVSQSVRQAGRLSVAALLGSP
jgi:hypothetical protein